MYTLLGAATLSESLYGSSENGSTLKGKNLINSFPFRVDPFSEGLGVQESNQCATKVVSLV